MGRDLNSRLDKSNFDFGTLNKLIGEMWEHRPPARSRSKRFKVFYAVQVENRPFRIKLFCNREHKLGDPYKRYLEKGIHQRFGLSGCPLKFSLAGKRQDTPKTKKLRFLKTFLKPRSSGFFYV